MKRFGLVFLLLAVALVATVSAVPTKQPQPIAVAELVGAPQPEISGVAVAAAPIVYLASPRERPLLILGIVCLVILALEGGYIVGRLIGPLHQAAKPEPAAAPDPTF